MRNRVLRAITVSLLCALLPRAGSAQSSPAEAFAAFLRVAGATGQSSTALNNVWPYPLNKQGESQRTWHVTGAHRISVSLDMSGDTARVDRVRWFEVVADTGALRLRVAEIFMQLARTSGPAELCSDPMGGPAYLFAPQHVERVWRRGLAGAPTRLAWDVLPGPAYAIAIDVGLFSDDRPMMRACSSKSP